jgi:hypothetical protein
MSNWENHIYIAFGKVIEREVEKGIWAYDENRKLIKQEYNVYDWHFEVVHGYSSMGINIWIDVHYRDDIKELIIYDKNEVSDAEIQLCNAEQHLEVDRNILKCIDEGKLATIWGNEHG